MALDKTPRKTPQYVKVLSAMFACFCIYVAIMISPLGPWVEVKILESKVKSNINPEELQQWATNLLASKRGNYEDFYGTNLPSGLKNVPHFNHTVRIGRDAVGQRSVDIFCGGKGGPRLLVGPQSMPPPNYPYVVPWIPGIYFVGY